MTIFNRDSPPEGGSSGSRWVKLGTVWGSGRVKRRVALAWWYPEGVCITPRGRLGYYVYLGVIHDASMFGTFALPHLRPSRRGARNVERLRLTISLDIPHGFSSPDLNHGKRNRVASLAAMGGWRGRRGRRNLYPPSAQRECHPRLAPLPSPWCLHAHLRFKCIFYTCGHLHSGRRAPGEPRPGALSTFHEPHERPPRPPYRRQH